MYIRITDGPRQEKTCLRGWRTKNGTGQPAHTRSLISAFVISLLKSIAFKPSTSKISIF